MMSLLRFFACALAAVLGLTAASAPAYAQATDAQAMLTLSTPYPSVVVEPGGQVSFEIKVNSSPAGRVGLDVDAPKGWKSTLRGGGFVVSSVYGGRTDVTLDVTVPGDAKGTGKVTVTATGPGGLRARLPLSLKVRGGGSGSVKLEAEFAKLTGKPTDTFEYNVTLRNETARKTTYALTVQGPSGWNVSANPTAQQRATTVTVDGGASETISVSADPPDNLTAGTYPIRLGVSGGGREAVAELAAEITGTVEVELSTPDDRLNASGTSGDRTRVPVVVTNKGSAPLNGVTLTGSPPSGWEVTFEPSTVNIEPQRSARVNAVITPSGDAVTGDYMVTLRAEKDGQSSSVDIRYTVETSQWWGLVGILVILLVAGGLWYVFRVYGRR
ncbi:NEW3 domain-containing protein [Thermopolyspora sp. NPDC052614]|uniref:COG1470 family protein n=1 Tax=Thermopolyspora sp. NPDC052614 TaxID=3155682 RepID=UPI00343E5CC2